MRIKSALKVGDILYRVDPRRLSVKVFRIIPKEVYNFAATDYENFCIECEKERFQLPLRNILFPFEFKGLLYFLREDDANNYIKTQIGMY